MGSLDQEPFSTGAQRRDALSSLNNFSFHLRQCEGGTLGNAEAGSRGPFAARLQPAQQGAGDACPMSPTVPWAAVGECLGA